MTNERNVSLKSWARPVLAGALTVGVVGLSGCMGPDETGTIKSEPLGKTAPGEGRFGGAAPDKGEPEPSAKSSEGR